MSESTELTLFRDSVRKFLEKEVQPNYEQWEKSEIFPRELWNKMGENGFLAVDTAEDDGGFGAPFEFCVVVIEELSRMGFAALASSASVHSDIVAPYVQHLGNDEQRAEWLPKMVSGEAVGAIAMTEPGAGSDLQGMRTTAKKDGDEYVLNGSKTFITNGQHADLVIVAAKTDPNAGAKGITLFLVDTKTPGFVKGRNLEKLGLHCGDTSELFFEDVRVPESAILGGLGKGFFNLMNELPRERLILAVMAIAACEGMIDWTVDYVSERNAFGQSLGQFQNTRFKLAELKTQTEVNKAFVAQCNAKYQAGELDVPTAAMVKLSTTELQGKVADECLQLFGGYGFMMEYPIARAFADARVQRIYGGTSEIMKEVIARSILGR